MGPIWADRVKYVDASSAQSSAPNTHQWRTNSGMQPGRKTPLLQKVHKWITNFGELPGRKTTLLKIR